MPRRLMGTSGTLTHWPSDRASATSSNEAAACLCLPLLTRKELALGRVNSANKP